jgi:hypothetical protein
MRVTSDFRHDVYEIYDLLVFFLDFLALEYGTDRLSRNAGIELPLYVA